MAPGMTADVPAGMADAYAKARALIQANYAGMAQDAQTAAQKAQDDAVKAMELFYPARAPRGAMTATGTGLGVPRMILRKQGGDLALFVTGKRHRLSMTLPAAK